MDATGNSNANVEMHTSNNDNDLSGIQTTSPSQLQDVTMEASYALGFRSPSSGNSAGFNSHTLTTTNGGLQNSPIQGRSLREYEEQMTTLRKENFNLKLRIYFLEEKNPTLGAAEGPDSIYKQNIDLKVEIESMRKEIQDKQELLIQAAKAIELMEEARKDAIQKHQLVVEELNEKVHYLEVEIKNIEQQCDDRRYSHEFTKNSFLLPNNDAQEKITELENDIKMYKLKCDNIHDLEEQLRIKEEKLKSYETKMKDLSEKSLSLERLLSDKEKLCCELESIKDQLYEHKKLLAEKSCILEMTEEQLKEKAKAYDNACKAAQKFLLHAKTLQETCELLKASKDIPNTVDNNLLENNTELERLHLIISEMKLEIDQLRSELKKKTMSLQGLVNKELWEKNREIERLIKMLNLRNAATASSMTDSSLVSPISPTVLSEEDQLQVSFTEAQYQQAVEKNHRLQRKVDLLIQRLEKTSAYSVSMDKLRAELEEAHKETAQANKWRNECGQLCTVLTVRLEELALFLDSLLKRKELGSVCADRRHAIRKAVDRSLDLSRSLNMSLSMTGLGMSEHSLAQLSSLSGFLEEGQSFMTRDSLDVSKAMESIHEEKNPTFNSPASNNSILAPKTILDTTNVEELKDEDKLLQSAVGKALYMSPPEKEIRRERRSQQILVTSTTNSPLNKIEQHSESEAWSEPDRNVSLARIGLEETKLNVNKKRIVRHSTDSDSTTGSDDDVDDLVNDNSKLPLSNSLTSNKDFNEKLKTMKNIISERDNQLVAAQIKLIECDNNGKRECIKLEERINELKKVHSEELNSIKNERDRLCNNLCAAELKLAEMRDDISELKQKHSNEIEFIITSERAKLEHYKREMVESLKKDWVSQIIYEKKINELNDYKIKIGESMNRELLLRTQVGDSEIMIKQLKKSIDESTLQISKAIVERTKCLNEKHILETNVKELESNINYMTAECAELNQRIVNLENENAVLQNRLITNKRNPIGTNTQNKTLPRNKNVNSDYVSEDTTNSDSTINRVTAFFQGNANKQELNRSNDNSSPDLGIESDAGRMSSVELSNLQRPMLKTIELTNSMTNLLTNVDNDTKILSPNNKSIDNGNTNNAAAENITKVPVIHDCEKVEQENKYLKRKYIRNKLRLAESCLKIQISNQRKEQAEKDIRQELAKTHNVLKNARTNMEFELEQKKNIIIKTSPKGENLSSNASITKNGGDETTITPTISIKSENLMQNK